VSDQDDNQDADSNEAVPPPKIIKIEDFADTSSPYESLDTETLAAPNGVAVARMASPEIHDHEGEAVLIGESMADLAFIIGDLAGTRGNVHVRELEFVHSVDLAFVTSGEIEDTLTGPISKERLGADRLLRALTSESASALLETLRGVDEHLAVRFETLLQRLFAAQVTVDLQTSVRGRPVRIPPERSAALYQALRTPTHEAPRTLLLAGRLVGAIADTRDFKLRLHTAWNRRHVIEGKFEDGLEGAMEQLWNKDVLATVSVEEERRGVRTTSYRFRLEEIRASPQLRL
jgi:hypothetical protein